MEIVRLQSWISIWALVLQSPQDINRAVGYRHFQISAIPFEVHQGRPSLKANTENNCKHGLPRHWACDDCAKETHKWNKRLSASHLSVWSGTTHHLVYLTEFASTIDGVVRASRSARCHRPSGNGEEQSRSPACFVSTGGAGESQTGLFLQTALQALTERDQTFLKHYQEKSVSDIGSFYGITNDAVHSRICRIRRKLERIAGLLERRISAEMIDK